MRPTRDVLILVIHLAKARLAFAGHRVSVGPRARVTGMRPLITNRGAMSIGPRARVHGRQFRVGLSTGTAGRLEVGEGVMLNQGCSIHAENFVRIGNYVMVSDLVAIHDTAFHAVDEGSSPYVAPVVIGDNVWIGRGAVVLPGVTIGTHSVVGAGAVVTKDVPARTVVAGNPARVLRAVQASDRFRRP